MCNCLFEYTFGDIKDKQKDITKLFPIFYDRVKAVEDMGGIRLLHEYPNLLHFKTHSGTKEKFWYDNYLKFVKLERFLKRAVQDKSTWNKAGDKVNLNKVSAKMLEFCDIQVFCSCPAAQFWGPNYILSVPSRDAKYTKPEKRPPKTRNPHQYGAVCKHLEVMLKVLPWYKSTFAKWLGKTYGETMAEMIKSIKAGEVKFKILEDKAREEMRPIEKEEIEKIEREQTPIVVPEVEQFPAGEVEEDTPTEEEPELNPDDEEYLKDRDQVDESLFFKNDMWKLNEDGEAPPAEAASTTGTTEDNIAYLPGGFKKVVKQLKRKPKLGGVTVIESQDAVRVYTGKSCFMVIPNIYKECLIDDISNYLKESEETDLDIRRRQTRDAILKSFQKKPYTQILERYMLWRRLYKNTTDITPESVAVSVKGVKKRANELADKAVKANWNDRGALEMLSSDAASGRPLGSYEPFGEYEWLYGIALRSTVGKTTIIYSLMMSPDFKAVEQIKISDIDVLEELPRHGISISGQTITPKYKSGLFPKRFMVNLHRELLEFQDKD